MTNFFYENLLNWNKFLFAICKHTNCSFSFMNVSMTFLDGYWFVSLQLRIPIIEPTLDVIPLFCFLVVAKPMILSTFTNSNSKIYMEWHWIYFASYLLTYNGIKSSKYQHVYKFTCWMIRRQQFANLRKTSMAWRLLLCLVRCIPCGGICSSRQSRSRIWRLQDATKISKIYSIL